MDEQKQFLSQEFFPERTMIFRRLTWSLLALIAATFVLMLWVLSSPDSYQEHVAEQPPVAAWPDGSAKTAADARLLAQQPTPAQPPSQP